MRCKKPRGIRNNNPLNIRIGNRWLGEVQYPTDTEFEQFREMEWGVRAAFIILRNYMKRYNLRTIPEIVTRWAPKSENDTLNYIKQVSKNSGYDTSYRFEWSNAREMCALFQAMCIVENGEPIPIQKIAEGYELAFKTPAAI